MGDQRVYGTSALTLDWLKQADTGAPGYIIILRAVTSTDFMSAEPYEFDFGLMKKIARRIVNEVDGVSRVTYDVTSKPPGMCKPCMSSTRPVADVE